LVKQAGLLRRLYLLKRKDIYSAGGDVSIHFCKKKRSYWREKTGVNIHKRACAWHWGENIGVGMFVLLEQHGGRGGITLKPGKKPFMAERVRVSFPGEGKPIRMEGTFVF